MSVRSLYIGAALVSVDLGIGSSGLIPRCPLDGGQCTASEMRPCQYFRAIIDIPNQPRRFCECLLVDSTIADALNKLETIPSAIKGFASIGEGLSKSPLGALMGGFGKKG